MSRLSLFALVLVCFLGGCGSYGNRMDQGNVDKIQKGVTTRAEIESWFGESPGMGMPPDGRRFATYTFTEAKHSAATYIPYVNMFAGGQIAHTQTLQIIYKDGVVQDYKFSDRTMRSEGGAFFRVTQDPTPATNPSAATKPK